MFTANSMNTLMEVMGIAQPFNGTALVISDERRELVREGAKNLMRMVHVIMSDLAILSQKNL